MTLTERQKELDQRYPQWQADTLYQRFCECEKLFGSCNFILQRTGCYSYARTKEIVDTLAANLYLQGVRKGTIAALLCENCSEFVFITFALAKLGAVLVPLNIKLKASELEQAINSLDACVLISPGMPQDGSMHSILTGRDLVISDKGTHELLVWERVKDNRYRYTGQLSGFLTKKPDDLQIPDAKIQADDLAVIFYTNGTTSSPKGVMLSHDNLLRSAYGNVYNRGFQEKRIIMIPIPLFHVYGFIEGLLSVLFVGGSIILQRRYDITETLRLMETFRAQDILAVPQIMMDLFEKDRYASYDLSPLVSCYCSASHCPDEVWNKIRDCLHIKDVITGYGLTESSGAAMQTAPGDCLDILESKVGKILQGGCAGDNRYKGNLIECRIVNPHTGKISPPGQPGELQCRGYTITRGYYKNPASAADKFTDDGWLRTGDIGSFDKDGYFTFQGRMNDTYKYNGENVLTYYIEEIIGRMDHIKNVAVIGLPDRRHGEIGAACVEVDDSAVSKESILDYCKKHLASFQLPSYIIFMKHDDWPVTNTGKIKKNILKQQILTTLNA